MGEKKLRRAVSSFVKEHTEYGGSGPESIRFVVKSHSVIGEIRRHCVWVEALISTNIMQRSLGKSLK